MNRSVQLLRDELQSRIGSCDSAALLRKKPARETLPSVVDEIPRGALTEIKGAPSSGRTSLLHSLLAGITYRDEFCALIDVQDSFDPESAEAAGVRLSQLVWVRCGGAVEKGLKAADMLIHGGGFGLAAIDFGNTADSILRRIPMVAWFRLRQGVENTRTAFVVAAGQFHAHPCSVLQISLQRNRTLWHGKMAGCQLHGFEVGARSLRDHRLREQAFRVCG
ncbi:MAG TPA: hypothetical protein VFQ91_27420 [Bryobacteraceae bacterium]|nr:hypothetical protein [Bryobacteraceae bacterium]